MMASFEWTSDTVMQLIDEYKNRPILWDRDHKHFRNGDRKMKAWLEMAAVFDIKETWEVKKKMNSLLASYRRERHKIRLKQPKPGQTAFVSNWFGYRALDSFLHEKYFDSTNSGHYTAQDEDGTTDVDSLDPKAPVEFKVESPEDDLYRYDEDLTTSNGIEEQEADDDAPPIKRPKVTEDPLQLKPGTSANLSRKDDCDVFGEYISGKMRHFDHKTRCVVQFLVSNILFQADMGKFRDNGFDCESLIGLHTASKNINSKSNTNECNQN
ncbi:hypothetical protein Trydic_g18361 [Trypoxylus dichotomus]